MSFCGKFLGKLKEGLPKHFRAFQVGKWKLNNNKKNWKMERSIS
jgi:hypothetical protein